MKPNDKKKKTSGELDGDASDPTVWGRSSGTDKKKQAVRNNIAGLDIDGKWWNKEEADLYQDVWSVVTVIEKDSHSLRQAQLLYARVYANKELLQGWTTGRTQPAQRPMTSAAVSSASPLGPRLTYNVSKICVDTAVNKIAKLKPRPMFDTDKGDAIMHRRGQLLQQYIDMLFYRTKFWKEASQMLRDATICGLGTIHFYGDPDLGPQCERIMPDELVVDFNDSRYGKPRQLHRVKLVDKDKLKAQYPDKDIIIDMSSPVRPGFSNITAYRRGAADQVAVIESWHLPSKPGAKDGKHSIVCSEGTLWVGDYTRDDFPFIFFRWNDTQVGFHGCGLVEELFDIQMQLNRFSKAQALALQLMGNPKIFIDASSGVNEDQLTNTPGGTIKFRGQPPTIWAPQNITADLDKAIAGLYQKAFEVTGISQLSSLGQKPAGVNSAVALLTFQDQASERFSLVSSNWDEMVCEASRQFIDVCHELDEAGHGEALKISVRSDNKTQLLDWTKVKLSNDEFQMKIVPSNALPTTPGGRLQVVTELLKAQALPTDYLLTLMGGDSPDLGKFVQLETAALDDALLTIALILDEGKYNPPDETMNLHLLLKLAVSTRLKIKSQTGIPQRNRDLLQQLIDETRQMIQNAELIPNAPPGPPPGRPPPQGAPPQ